MKHQVTTLLMFISIFICGLMYAQPQVFQLFGDNYHGRSPIISKDHSEIVYLKPLLSETLKCESA